MLGGASGSPILDQYVGPVASVISLFVDENYGNKLDVGTGIVTIKIYDYKPGQNLEINCTVVSSGVKMRERAITYVDWSAGGRQ